MNLVELPPELVLLLETGIIFVVTQVLKALGGAVGQDITGWAAVITAGLLSAATAFLNGGLGLIPEIWGPVATTVLNLIVLLLGSMGVYGFYKRTRS